MMMSGPCYEVSVDPRIVHGTVQANFAMAFAGTPVTLTATPDSDHVLKDGTLKYNDGSDHAIAGPSYIFTMPDSDVTVSAEFIHQFVRYVRAGGAGSKDGTSWTNASDDLQAMMDALTTVDPSYTGPRIVKVAAGTYKPQYKPNSSGVSIPAAGNRDSAFILRAGIQVWGGYPASGGDDPSRNPSTYVTVLSGDIDGDNTKSGNAYHVVLGVNIPANSGTVLDGLTITGGNADDSGNITVFSYSVDRDNGGGMYNTNSSPVLTNVTLSGNIAYVTYHNGDGGGMYNTNSSPVLVNVTISGNDAGNDGGGIYNDGHSSPVLVNVLISGNKAYSGGSGIKNDGSSPILTNVTISGNLAGTIGSYMHGSIYNSDSSSPQINNSIIWGNWANSSPGIYNDDAGSVPDITHSIVQESGGSGGSWDNNTGTDGGNNLDVAAGAPNSPFVGWQDPNSVTVPNSGGDYRLNGGPAVNAGNNSLYPDTWIKWQTLIGAGAGISREADYDMYIAPHLGKDLAGAARVRGTRLDMGAYEKE
jgi:hypothetical protein